MSPGLSPGILSIGGTYTQTAQGISVFEINGLTAGTDHDQIEVRGAVALGGALNIVSNFTPTTGDTFILIDNNGSAAVLGTFAGLSEGAVFSSNGRAFRASYQAGDGNGVARAPRGCLRHRWRRAGPQ